MPNYLVHFNPYHDPKTGRFDFSKKYPADLIRQKEANHDYDNDLQLKMRVDFNKAYQQQGDGPNAKSYNVRKEFVEKEGNRLAKDEYDMRLKNGESLSVDDYCDIAWAWMDTIKEKMGYNVYDMDISHLMDLGYNKQDAEDIAKWFHHTLIWDYVYDEEHKTFRPKNNDKEKNKNA